MVLYFTGTGNSRWCAEKIADAIGDKAIDTSTLIKKGDESEFNSDTPWVFVAPTYSWQLPRIFTKFILNSSFTSNKKAYFVMTCGSDIGDSSKYNKMLCLKKGFDYCGTATVVMPENYIAMFTSPEKEKAERIIKKAEPVVDKVIHTIKSGEMLAENKISFADKIKSAPVNKLFYSMYVKSKNFYATDKCVSCGLCAKKCPTNCISMKDSKPSWSAGCTHCMACICLCPYQAIEYGKKTQGKVRYNFFAEK